MTTTQRDSPESIAGFATRDEQSSTWCRRSILALRRPIRRAPYLGCVKTIAVYSILNSAIFDSEHHYIARTRTTPPSSNMRTQPGNRMKPVPVSDQRSAMRNGSGRPARASPNESTTDLLRRRIYNGAHEHSALQWTCNGAVSNPRSQL